MTDQSQGSILTSSGLALCTWQWCAASASGCCTTRTLPAKKSWLKKCIFLRATGNHNLSILSFGVKFNYLDAVDDMLLLGARPIEVVRAHNVDCRGGGTPLNHVLYMVRVWDVEPANTNINTSFKGWEDPEWDLLLYHFKISTIPNLFRHILVGIYTSEKETVFQS